MERILNFSTRKGGVVCLIVAGLLAVVGVRPASAAVCTAFTLTEAQVSVFQNGSWINTPFQQIGPSQFTIARNANWPAQVTMVLRWDVNSDAHPEILPGASYAPEPVYLDYQFVGEGFGTSFGVVAQVNDIALTHGAHPLYMEFAILLPSTGCDLIRSDIATLTVTPALQIDPGQLPQLSCLPPNCGPEVRQPGHDVINPGFVQPLQPQHLVPQLQLQGGQ